MSKHDRQLKEGRRDKQPRPDDILRKGGPMKDRTKYNRKRKHKGECDNEH